MKITQCTCRSPASRAKQANEFKPSPCVSDWGGESGAGAPPAPLAAGGSCGGRRPGAPAGAAHLGHFRRTAHFKTQVQVRTSGLWRPRSLSRYCCLEVFVSLLRVRQLRSPRCRQCDAIRSHPLRRRDAASACLWSGPPGRRLCMCDSDGVPVASMQCCKF